ncbi:MAG: dihydrodipicolinate synthase family protein [Chloroflexota bacterium]
MAQTNRFNGAWTALISPQSSSGDVDVPALQSFTEYLIEDIGIDGLYLCGSTGEGIYTTSASRKVVAETVMAQAAGRTPVIVHVGSQSSADAIELARHAQSLDVAGISSIIPAGYSSIAAAKSYFTRLADAAPSLPLLPYLMGLSTSPVPLMEELLSVPNVAGTKYTGPNMYEMEQILRLGERGERPFGWTVFSGMDEQCLCAALYGAHGNIGSTLNFMPGAYKAIHRWLADGDIERATELQMKINRVTEAAISVDFMGSLYEMVRLLGHDCGEPKLPNLPLSNEQRNELHQKLDALNWKEVTGKIL